MFGLSVAGMPMPDLGATLRADGVDDSLVDACTALGADLFETLQAHGRPALLQLLKREGVGSTIGDRQRVANAVGRAVRTATPGAPVPVRPGDEHLRLSPYNWAVIGSPAEACTANNGAYLKLSWEYLISRKNFN